MPEKLSALLLDTREYQVQVCLSRQFNNWVPIGRTYDDFFEATLSALSLMEVWELPKNVRVVAVE